MAYHTIGSLRKREYSASNQSSTTAAVVVIGNRAKLVEVLCAPKVAQTQAATWTLSVNGTQVTGLSSISCSTASVGESSGMSSASPTADTYLARGDIVSVVGSSQVPANWTVVVNEF